MLTRAHLLIEKEYRDFNKDPPWGVDAIPLTDSNIFEWGAKISGPKDTIWEGGVFRLYIRFDDNFNLRPPQVCFHTIPFHPNVDMITGAPCLDILDDWEKWREKFSLTFVLLSVQMMLSNPILDNAVNMAAADLIERSPRAYRQMVLDCVVASQRVEAGLSAQLTASTSSTRIPCVPTREKTPSKSITPPPIRVSRLSFEDYLSTWKEIATSKPQADVNDPCTSSGPSIGSKPMKNNHIRLTEDEVEEQINKQLDEHNGLIYGRFRVKQSQIDEKAAKLERINQMKKIYLPPRIPPGTPVQEVVNDPPRQSNRDDPWEGEVDDLVAWSAKLDTNLIDV